MTFSSGGNQEARGGGLLGDRYFEGMLEELDAEFEFHHDTDTNMLYWVRILIVEQNIALIIALFECYWDSQCWWD